MSNHHAICYNEIKIRSVGLQRQFFFHGLRCSTVNGINDHGLLHKAGDYMYYFIAPVFNKSPSSRSQVQPESGVYGCRAYPMSRDREAYRIRNGSRQTLNQ
ncbi:hypothetical protein E4U60_001577 [Claviceps pazoutovae]|uniref:Uncharacterized protein n=1 Tax=Claviceps pazoutovae TaxID=1649127 RepID=A0A9P7MCZ2_9HYPO|nr:hypothetical protein E4U60_001577 [Claviceps pazoutovae]